jgi:hypothetical protein
MTFDPNAFTIRTAQAADANDLRRLAELDSSRMPNGPLLVGEVDGELVAAVPIAGGPGIARDVRGGQPPRAPRGAVARPGRPSEVPRADLALAARRRGRGAHPAPTGSR